MIVPFPVFALLLSAAFAAPPPEDWKKVRLKDGREIVGRSRLADPLTVLDGTDRRFVLSSTFIRSKSDLDAIDVPVFIRVPQPPPTPKTKPIATIAPNAVNIRIAPLQADGKRQVSLTDPKQGNVTFTQVITEIGPRLVKWEGVEFVWVQHVPLASHDMAMINRLIAGNVDLSQPTSRLLLARFLRQAGLFGDAENLLDGLKDAPAPLPPQVAAERKKLQSAFAGSILRELRIAAYRGDAAGVGALAAKGKREWLEPFDLVEWDDTVKRAADGLAKAKEFTDRLKELLAALNKDDAVARSQTLVKAGEALKTGIHPDQAMAAAEALAKLPTGGGDNDKLARLTAALTMGAGPNPTDFARVEKLWAARAKLREYLTAKTNEQRFAVRRTFNTIKEVSLADYAALLRTLPPVEAGDDLADEFSATGKTHKGKSAFTVGNLAYVAKLPVGYHPGRDWPVIVALYPQPGKPSDMLAFWSAHADRWGAILLCPEYASGGPGYRNEPNQHAAVLDAVRDAARRYRIDFDRIWLTGHATGAAAAWGAVLSRPDAFAAAAPFVGGPLYNLYAYYTNAANTAIWALDGDRNLASFAHNDKAFSVLCANGYDAQFSVLVGRGAEGFAEEFDAVMDFFSRRRRNPFPDRLNLVSFRRQDDRFHWFEFRAGIAGTWKIEAPTSALDDNSYATAKARADGNEFRVDTERVADFRIYLAPEMVDFDKPITVKLNDRVYFSGLIKPELERLLTSALRMGDRRLLYWSYIDVKVR